MKEIFNRYMLNIKTLYETYPLKDKFVITCLYQYLIESSFHLDNISFRKTQYINNDIIYMILARKTSIIATHQIFIDDPLKFTIIDLNIPCTDLELNFLQSERLRFEAIVRKLKIENLLKYE